MSLKQVFLKDSFVYGFSSYLSLFAAMMLTPIYTRTLTKEDYGVMDLYNTWNNFFIVVIPLGLTAAIIRLYQDFSSKPTLKIKYLGTLLSSLTLSCIVYLFGHIFFSGYIELYYHNTELNKIIYILSLFIVVFTVLSSYFQYLNQVRFHKFKYLTINISSFLILSILGYILVVTFKFGILGFFIAGFFSSLVSFILCLLIVKNAIYLKFDLKIFKTAFKYAFPIFLVLIFLKFTFIIDRIIINYFLDLKTIGEYSIVLRISNVFQLIVSAFATAWFPYAMKIINDKNRNMIYAEAYKYYIYIFSFIAIIIMLFSKELLHLFAPTYLNIEHLLYISVPTVLVGGVNYFYNLGLHIFKKSIYFIYSSVLSFFINVIASIILTTYFGVIGIAIGSLIAILSWVGSEYYFSKKVSEIKFNILYLLTSIILLVFTGYFIFFVNKSIDSMLLLIKIKIIFLFSFTLFILLNKKTKGIILELKRIVKN